MINADEQAKVTAAWGTEVAILHQDDLKKRMNKIMITWQSGCFEKMDDHPVHTL